MNNFIQGLENYARKSAGFSAGLVIGSVLGAGAMLLLAPQSGKRTRAKIQQKSVQLLDQTAEVMDDLVDQVGDKARETSDSVRRQVKELQNSSNDVIDEQKKRLTALVDAGKKAVQGPELVMPHR